MWLCWFSRASSVVVLSCFHLLWAQTCAHWAMPALWRTGLLLSFITSSSCLGKICCLVCQWLTKLMILVKRCFFLTPCHSLPVWFLFLSRRGVRPWDRWTSSFTVLHNWCSKSEFFHWVEETRWDGVEISVAPHGSCDGVACFYKQQYDCVHWRWKPLSGVVLS